MSLAATITRISKLKADLLALAGLPEVVAVDQGAQDVMRAATSLELLGKKVAAKAKAWPRETRVDVTAPASPAGEQRDWAAAQLPKGDLT
jgi:hypothetical protein